MTRADKLLTAAVFLLSIISAGLFYFRSHYFLGAVGHHQAVIKSRGKIVSRIDLDKTEQNRTFAVTGRLGPSVVEVDKGRIRIKEAPCPDRICVRQGWIGKGGESIICVPGEIVIHIEGVAPVDAVTR